jgi:hypothetical protein
MVKLQGTSKDDTSDDTRPGANALYPRGPTPARRPDRGPTSRLDHTRRMRGHPINHGSNNTNTGLGKTRATMISHCFQIGTAQWAGPLLSRFQRRARLSEPGALFCCSSPGLLHAASPDPPNRPAGLAA